LNCAAVAERFTAVTTAPFNTAATVSTTTSFFTFFSFSAYSSTSNIIINFSNYSIFTNPSSLVTG
jgi:hypothetical protein